MLYDANNPQKSRVTSAERERAQDLGVEASDVKTREDLAERLEEWVGALAEVNPSALEALASLETPVSAKKD